MRVLLVAPPGAGKGTQAEKLASHYGVVHLSSGELLRQAVKAGTEVGEAATAYLSRGDLVPDDLIFDLMMGPVLDASRHGGYILDGFPRNLRQAEAAYRTAQLDTEIELQAVIYLTVSREELTRRLLARAQSEGRSDDSEDVIAHRFEVYATETEPLLAFYRGRGLVVEIDGAQEEERVFADIVGSFTTRGDDVDDELTIVHNRRGSL
jgi:adenylate kinase